VGLPDRLSLPTSGAHRWWWRLSWGPCGRCEPHGPRPLEWRRYRWFPSIAPGGADMSSMGVYWFGKSWRARFELFLSPTVAPDVLVPQPLVKVS
jgi:hypothetical protein